MACASAEHARGITRIEHEQLVRDLQHIPDDRLDWVPMGKAKTPRQIVVECAGAYRWLAAKLGNAPDADEQWGAVCGMSPGTREATVELLGGCWDELVAAFDGVEEAMLEEKRQVFWGEATVETLLFFCEWHTTYHSGQLNYIQTLLGDTEMHMEPPA